MLDRWLELHDILNQFGGLGEGGEGQGDPSAGESPAGPGPRRSGRTTACIASKTPTRRWTTTSIVSSTCSWTLGSMGAHRRRSPRSGASRRGRCSAGATGRGASSACGNRRGPASGHPVVRRQRRGGTAASVPFFLHPDAVPQPRPLIKVRCSGLGAASGEDRSPAEIAETSKIGRSEPENGSTAEIVETAETKSERSSVNPSVDRGNTQDEPAAYPCGSRRI